MLSLTLTLSRVIPEPNFVYMDVVSESVDSPAGDDDKVYLFFSENAMEYDFYSKVAVSRVARVCKVNAEILLGKSINAALRCQCEFDTGCADICEGAESFPSCVGGHGRTADAAEEVDIVHEGSSGLLSS